jgi:hypothetical protein
VAWLAATRLFPAHLVMRDYADQALPAEIAPRFTAPPPKPAPAPARRPVSPSRPPPVAAPPPILTVPAPDTPPAGEAPAPASPAGPEVAAAAPPEASPQPPVVEAPPAPGQRYPINPGYWEVVERWLVLSKTERYCVEPQNITTFMSAPCNHIYHCAYPVQRIEDARFHFEGVIWKTGERYQVRGGGDYSATRLHLSVGGHGHWHMVPVLFSASLDGRFLGADCPADAKRIRQHG